MQKFGYFVALLLFTLPVLGQTQPQTQPTPNAQAEMQRQQPEMEARRRELANSHSRLRAISEMKYRRPLPKEALRDIRELYREPSDKELKKMRPMNEDLAKYAAFLKRKNTGIVRLEPYLECGDSTMVLSASEACLEYTLPGNGSDYSFRKRNHRLGRLADLRFDRDAFSSPGVLQQAIFVGIGDVPLEDLGPNTAGILYLKDLKPADRAAEAIEMSEKFNTGTENGGFYYASSVRVVENMTYVLRSIAYRGVVPRSVGTAVFNELELDERADVTVAFRIVRRHDSGGVTIVWTELERRKAPEFIREKPAKPARSPFAAAG